VENWVNTFGENSAGRGATVKFDQKSFRTRQLGKQDISFRQKINTFQIGLLSTARHRIADKDFIPPVISASVKALLHGFDYR